MVDLRIGNEPETLAVDEKLYAELADVEANPLGESSLPGISDVQEKRANQLAFMLMMHTKNRAIQMITRLSDPVNGLDIWRRFLEVWEPVNRGRYRTMLMQLLQSPLTESRGPSPGGVGTSCTAVRGTEFGHAPGHNQSSNTGAQPTGFRVVQICHTERVETLGYDDLKSVWKEKGKRKGKERGKSKDKLKEGTSDTSNAKCSFCKGKDLRKSLTWPAEKKTMSRELSKLSMIDSGASVHVCPPKHVQGDSLRKSSETRPLPGA